MKKQDYKVVMLPTTQYAPLAIGNTLKQLELTANSEDKNQEWLNPYYTAQHLYILSNDEIKEDDWVIDETGKLNQVKSIESRENNNLRYNFTSKTFGLKDETSLGNPNNFYKKIVVSTDSSLKTIIPRHNDFDSEYSLPSIPQSFISKYIEMYNAGTPITEVALEVEDNGYPVDMEGRGGSEIGWMSIWNLKLRSDSTVIIHPNKMYSRDEVLLLIKSAYIQGVDDNFDYNWNGWNATPTQIATRERWIEENL